jgi:unsaturated chondroitin disaccharide hydrolase
VKILKANLPEFTHHFKEETSVNNYYLPAENVEWTTGFLTGQYWLAWELTHDPAFKDAALIQVDSFDHRIRNKIGVAHHDMGFLYSLSCIAAWRLTGSEKGRDAAIFAADNLLTRFHKVGNFIQAWGELGAKQNYRFIIDCLMNLPLLYWASEETNDKKYRETALLHSETSLAHLVRPDFSTYHTFFMCPETGAPVRGVTAQGYKNSSPWARGQAWGIYGTALDYLYTKNPKCLELFYGITDFFINRTKNAVSDGIPYWDLIFSDKHNQPKDSSAAAIAACGMLEMAKHLPAEKAAYYKDTALEIAGTLARNYAATPDHANGLLKHGVYAKRSPFNSVADWGVNECTLWGDYFYLELLMRLTNADWAIYW